VKPEVKLGPLLGTTAASCHDFNEHKQVMVQKFILTNDYGQPNVGSHEAMALAPSVV
jgi:hypothetical protein